MNPAAPFLNSLVTPGNPNAANVSFASNYQNVSPALHPSEPNYVWQVSGVTGPLNDNDPYPNNIVNAPNLIAVMAAKGETWRSYQEDTDLVNTNGANINGDHGAGVAPTNTVAPKSQFTVPLTSFSGTSPTYTNPYNGSHQYNYAAKHNPEVFFTGHQRGNSHSARHDAEQSAGAKLRAAAATGRRISPATPSPSYNWITPDQFNDMHSALNTDFTYAGQTWTAGLTKKRIAQGDNFLSIVVPEIEASQAFKDNGDDRDLERRDRGRRGRGIDRRFRRDRDHHLAPRQGQRLHQRHSLHPLVRSGHAAEHL